MPAYAYQRLTALDNSFLILEKPNAYMHVASTQIFDAGPLATASGGVRANEIRGLIAARLHDIPRYRQRLEWVPVDGGAVWVDDDRFNLDYHVRHTSLPRPGSMEQLKRLSARVMQQHLDRRRPLWEMWIVEGIEGNRFALISKVHHCMIDGISGVDLMNVLMSPDPDEREVPPSPPFVPRPAPGPIELALGEVARRVRMPLRALRDVRSFVSEAQDVRREIGTRLRAVTEMLGGTLRMPSETPINHSIGPHRRFDWLTQDLAELKRLRHVLGGSLNDVVLTIVTGAVRRFLIHRHCDPAALDFRVMAPVSVRSEAQRGELGNQVSAWILELPIGESDRKVQLESIRQRTAELTAAKSAIGAEVLTRAAEWTPTNLLALGARNLTRLLPFNMVVTNVPGPQLPLYTLGARMERVFPHVPLVDRLGIGIALMSYDGKLCWGVNADYDLVPDLDEFMASIRDSFAELRRAAGAVPRLVEESDEGEVGSTADPARA